MRCIASSPLLTWPGALHYSSESGQKSTGGTVVVTTKTTKTTLIKTSMGLVDESPTESSTNVTKESTTETKQLLNGDAGELMDC